MTKETPYPSPWYYEVAVGYEEPKEGQLFNVRIVSRGPPEVVVLEAWACCDDNKCRKVDIEHLIACVNACRGFDPKRVRGILMSVLAARKAAGIALPPEST